MSSIVYIALAESVGAANDSVLPAKALTPHSASTAIIVFLTLSEMLISYSLFVKTPSTR
jgi:hypothetical protein